MNPQILQDCTDLAFQGKITFPETVKRMAATGVERYCADLVTFTKIIYSADGQNHTVALPLADPPVIAGEFSAAGVQEAIRAIQHGQIDYPEFLRRIMRSGAVFYDVFIRGGRTIYVGRGGELHVETFPVAPGGGIMAKAIPDGYRSVTPSLTFKDTQKALDFYQKAFGAKVLDLFPNPAGKGIMHAVMQVGDSFVMMGDEMPQCRSAESIGESAVSLFLYVPNVDEVFRQAVAAGAAVTMPVAEMFWGDRCGNVRDPFGYSWMIATHTRDLSKEEVRRGGEAFFAGMAGN
jgi:PhnB protein